MVQVEKRLQTVKQQTQKIYLFLPYFKLKHAIQWLCVHLSHFLHSYMWSLEFVAETNIVMDVICSLEDFRCLPVEELWHCCLLVLF